MILATSRTLLDAPVVSWSDPFEVMAKLSGHSLLQAGVDLDGEPRYSMPQTIREFALDNRTQEIVRESLEQLNSTRIVIAHRLRTIARADMMYVLVAGRIVERGCYDELMQNDGPFVDLAKRQFV